MNLLLLPGGSKRNREWIAEVEKAFASLFGKTHAQNYSHWDTDENEVDLEHELKGLSDQVKDLDPYCVFAKSAGTTITCKATSMGILRPKACLFAGFPLAMVTNYDLPVADWLLATEFPITILQNSHDPLGSHEDVVSFFNSVGRQNVSIHSLPGDTHDYLDFAALKEFAGQLPKS
jgi:hypothetical protein